MKLSGRCAELQYTWCSGGSGCVIAVLTDRGREGESDEQATHCLLVPRLRVCVELYLHFIICMTCCSWPRTSRGDGDAGNRTPSHGVVSAHCRLPVPCHVRMATAARGNPRREQTGVGRRRCGGERLHRCHSEHGATGKTTSQL